MSAPKTMGRCEGCQETKDVAASEELDVTMCGPCFAARAEANHLSNLLTKIEGFIRRYVVLPGEDELTALVLWVAHTHALDGAHATPYLLILSPEKQSGKTRLTETLELVVSKPWRLAGASEAVLFRKIERDRPTLLLDEIDAIFKSHSDRTEPLRQLFNSGNRPGAHTSRCGGANRDELHDFSVYCAKALAGIDKGSLIPETIRDRSIPITMQRKTTAEPVERFRHRDADAQAEQLRLDLEQWGETASERLLEAEPDIPTELDDRASEALEPLLAIADEAGGDWPTRIRKAAVALSANKGDDERSLGNVVLAAARDAFGSDDVISTKGMLALINADDDRPLGGFRDGAGLDSRGLARLLKPYRIKSRSVRPGDGSIVKGYRREQFEEAWKRWLPPLPSQPTQATQGTQPHEQAALEQADVSDVSDVSANTGRTDGAVDATPKELERIDRLLSDHPDEGDPDYPPKPQTRRPTPAQMRTWQDDFGGRPNDGA